MATKVTEVAEAQEAEEVEEAEPTEPGSDLVTAESETDLSTGAFPEHVPGYLRDTMRDTMAPDPALTACRPGGGPRAVWRARRARAVDAADARKRRPARQVPLVGLPAARRASGQAGSIFLRLDLGFANTCFA